MGTRYTRPNKTREINLQNSSFPGPPLNLDCCTKTIHFFLRMSGFQVETRLNFKFRIFHPKILYLANFRALKFPRKSRFFDNKNLPALPATDTSGIESSTVGKLTKQAFQRYFTRFATFPGLRQPTGCCLTEKHEISAILRK